MAYHARPNPRGRNLRHSPAIGPAKRGDLASQTNGDRTMFEARKALMLSTVLIGLAGTGSTPAAAENGRNAAAAAGALGGFALGAAAAGAAQPRVYYER